MPGSPGLARHPPGQDDSTPLTDTLAAASSATTAPVNLAEDQSPYDVAAKDAVGVVASSQNKSALIKPANQSRVSSAHVFGYDDH